MIRSRARRIAAQLIAGATAGCIAITSAQAQAVQPTAPVTPTAAIIAKARADSAKFPYTQSDIDFMGGMIHHHAQAIVMARMAPTHGAGPTVATLCARIINAQSDEIKLMQQWLRDRNQTVPDATGGAMKMTMGGMDHEMLMPGMLSDEQMKQLDASSGLEFDRLFLTFMIQHHMGAVGMVNDLFASAGGGQDETVFKFAGDVSVDQTTEIARMQKMLTIVVFEGRTP